jgi:Transcriptional regulators containing a DNA-binding HTH domain and an aminotransferase domain (MocR family) and their eukaryotic orthologs
MIGRKRRTRDAEDPTPNLHGKRRRHSIVALKWSGWIAQRPNHYINNFTGRFAMSLRREVSTITRRDFPSSRALATDFGVSRFTVNLALSRLHAEGYLQSKLDRAPSSRRRCRKPFLSARTTRAAPPTERPSRLSNRVKDIPDHRAGKQFDFGIAGPPGVSFVPAVAALDEFPIEFGNDSEHKFSHKKERICSSMRQAVAIPSCARRWQLFVRLQRRALRSRSNHHHRWNAAGNDDQRDGAGKSRRGCVD